MRPRPATRPVPKIDECGSSLSYECAPMPRRTGDATTPYSPTAKTVVTPTIGCAVRVLTIAGEHRTQNWGVCATGAPDRHRRATFEHPWLNRWALMSPHLLAHFRIKAQAQNTGHATTIRAAAMTSADFPTLHRFHGSNMKNPAVIPRVNNAPASHTRRRGEMHMIATNLYFSPGLR